MTTQQDVPSADEWLREAYAAPESRECGMFLLHNGVVRQTPRAAVRDGKTGLPSVSTLKLSFDADKLAEAEAYGRSFEGVKYVRTWIASGELNVGDTMMFVLVGADIRPHCISALDKLVQRIKTNVVSEEEIFQAFCWR